MSITVAIVTARRTDETRYDEWRGIRTWLLEHAPARMPPGLNGELAALLSACLAQPLSHHVMYQLLALRLQTRPPDCVIVVDRASVGREFDEAIRDVDSLGLEDVIWAPPLVSAKELQLVPEAALASDDVVPRSREHVLNCADKNTAIAMCRTDHLVMLDDCCLPSFGLVAAAERACEAGKVLLLGFRKITPVKEEDDVARVEHAEANWQEKTPWCPFGIFASPLKYLLAVNGFNPDIDGFRGWADAELKERMDRYLRMREVDYAIDPAARVYEIGHDTPWSDGELPEGVEDWRELIPEGWRAPGPDLTKINELYRVHADAEDLIHGDPEEEEDDEEEDDEEEGDEE